MEGSRGTLIATLVERQSRFVVLVKLREKRTEVVVDALIKAVRKLPVAIGTGEATPGGRLPPSRVTK